MPKTLLLADDSVTIRKVVSISFANEDVNLVSVDNGDDAILKAREIRPDAILADVVMPGKNGYEVCEAIKADPDLQHIPVLLLTGTFEAFDEARAQSAGAAGHVAKPFEAQALVEEVRRLFSAGETPALASDPAGETPTRKEDYDFFDEADDGAQVAFAETVLEAPATLEPDGAEVLSLDDSDLLPALPDSVSTAEHTMAIMDGDTGADLAMGDVKPDLAIGDAGPDLSLDSTPSTSSLTAAADDFLAPDPPAAATEPSIGGLVLEPEDSNGSSSDDISAPTDPLGGDTLGTVPDGLDFDFESPDDSANDDPLLRGDGNLAEATVLDPAGASGFDVSSSDLVDPLAADPGEASASGPALSLDDPVDAPLAQPLSDDMTVLASDVPDLSALESQDVQELATLHEAEMAADATVLAPDLDIPMPDAPEPARAVEPPPQATPQAVAVPEASQVLAKIAPQVQKQLHDTLEKIAWESFSDVTEKIVRQTVEKIEAIAWEVIPQLAESLVREEIRKMKGDPEDPS
jgi:CheY-like chemotaxis protein